jgi:hypothetical protein
MTVATIDQEFVAFETGAIEPKNFPHREHVRFAYEMLRRLPFAETAARFSRGLRHLARKSGDPHLYHETITIAFLSIIGERIETTVHSDWSEFARANADLLDKTALRRWYSPRQLDNELTRRTFCLPWSLSSKPFRHALAAYTIIFSAYIIWSSTRTAVQAHNSSSPVFALAVSEIAAGVLFATPRTRWIGAIGLLLIFATASAAELYAGGTALRFLLYGATTGFIWRLSSLEPGDRRAAQRRSRWRRR